MHKYLTLLGLASVVVLAATLRAQSQPLGIFTDHGDVGKPSTIGPGSATYDGATKTYTIAGGGENMWASADHFHYVYKKMSGDVALEATIAFGSSNPTTGTPNGHRKACLIIRQTLDSDSVYADAAAHGEGLTSLQWRDVKGAATQEVQSNVVGPKRLRIEKRGNYVSMWIGDGSGSLRPAGGSARIEFTGDFYVGLGVTAHDTGRIETATFSDVTLGACGRKDDADQHARDDQRPIEGPPRCLRRHTDRADRGAELVSRCNQHALLQQRRPDVQGAGRASGNTAEFESPERAGTGLSRRVDAHQQ